MNTSKSRQHRFWKKWAESGACISIPEHIEAQETARLEQIRENESQARTSWHY